jgi:hypothetical protein
MSFKNNLGIFYTCFTETKAVEYSLDKLYEIYPTVPVYLVSDGGTDYTFLEKKFIDKRLKTLLLHDSRSFIPKITNNNFLEPDIQNYMLESSKEFIERIYQAILFCDCKNLLIMEPDVLVRGKLTITDHNKFLGSRVNKGLSAKLKEFLSTIPEAKVVDCWGATPAIFKSEYFLKIYNLLKLNDEMLSKLCSLEPRFCFYDVMLAILFGIIGIEEEYNNDIIECFRDVNWEHSNKPLVHQYRAKYPLSSEGYNGTHILHKDGLKDVWNWSR